MKWAIVLGASSGLGLACAKQLARDGFAICAVFREPRQRLPEVHAALDEMRSFAPAVLDLNVNALSADGMAEVLTALSGALGAEQRVHVLVHSIARGCVKPLAAASLAGVGAARCSVSAESSPEELFAAAYRAQRARRVGVSEPKPEELLQLRDIELTIEAMGTNLFSWVMALFNRGFFAKDARVVGLTSEGARRVWRGYAAVSAAKAALETIVKALAVELGPFGIRANLVQAGITDTPSLRMIPEQELLKLTAVQRNPLGRLTQPSDVANAVSLLCRPEAAWINGTTLVVDGGEQLC